MSPVSVEPKFHVAFPFLSLALLAFSSMALFGASNAQSALVAPSAFNLQMNAFYGNLSQAQTDQLVALVNRFDVNEPQFHALFNNFSSGLSDELKTEADGLYAQIAQTKFVAYTYGWQISLTPALSPEQLADLESCKITPIDLSMPRLAGQSVTASKVSILTFGDWPIDNYGSMMVDAIENHNLDLSTLTVGEQIAINRRMWKSSIDRMQEPNNPLAFTVQAEIGNGQNESKWLFRYSFNGTGQHRMVVIGNSHADMIAQEIASSFKGNYKTLDFFTIQGCLPFNVSYPQPRYNDLGCQDYHAAVLEMIADVKPDIVFCNFYWDTMGKPPLTDPIKKDQILKDIQKPLNVIAKNTKLIYFSAPNLNFPIMTSFALADKLWAGESLEAANLPLAQQMSASNVHYVRLANLKCPKCVIVDWTKAFCDKQSGVCNAYNPLHKLAYAYDQIHFSWLGARKTLPLLGELATALTQKGLHPKKLQ